MEQPKICQTAARHLTNRHRRTNKLSTKLWLHLQPISIKKEKNAAAQVIPHFIPQSTSMANQLLKLKASKSSECRTTIMDWVQPFYPLCKKLTHQLTHQLIHQLTHPIKRIYTSPCGPLKRDTCQLIQAMLISRLLRVTEDARGQKT